MISRRLIWKRLENRINLDCCVVAGSRHCYHLAIFSWRGKSFCFGDFCRNSADGVLWGEAWRWNLRILWSFGEVLGEKTKNKSLKEFEMAAWIHSKCSSHFWDQVKRLCLVSSRAFKLSSSKLRFAMIIMGIFKSR